MTRVLGAVAIGILIDRGLIPSVDVAASTYLPEWRNDARRTITIRELLTMSSGIQTKFSNDPGSPFMQSYYGADVERIVANAPLVAEPGKAFFYDNHNNHAISLIIERVAKTPYIAFVSRNIWRPLGASDANMMLDHPGGRAMAYCCTIVTPRDWLRVGEMLRMGGVWNHRRIVSAAWVSQMRQPSRPTPISGSSCFWDPPGSIRRSIDNSPTAGDAGAHSFEGGLLHDRRRRYQPHGHPRPEVDPPAHRRIPRRCGVSMSLRMF